MHRRSPGEANPSLDFGLLDCRVKPVLGEVQEMLRYYVISAFFSPFQGDNTLPDFSLLGGSAIPRKIFKILNVLIKTVLKGVT